MKKRGRAFSARIRTFVKELVPRFIVRGVRNAQTTLRRTRLPDTRTVFSGAGTTPAYLGLSELETLQKKYSFLPEYGYDFRSLETRGMLRAKEVLRLTMASTATTFLELGCWDAMVSCCLQREGKQATAIDINDNGFSGQAEREGVRLLRMDAGHLQLPEGSFDCVFSYDAFEHFCDPEAVIQNALKVLKKQGHLFLSFGPLYWSPFGQHAYRTITVPYCQHLFPRSVLNEYASAKGLEPIEFGHVNGWSIIQYRNLWKKYASSLKSVRYSETLNLAHLDLIRTYPACFRSKTNYFDDVIVESITAVFEKVQ